jgi:hypothetical protein
MICNRKYLVSMNDTCNVTTTYIDFTKRSLTYSLIVLSRVCKKKSTSVGTFIDV